MVGKKEYAQINELLNARLDAKKVLIAVHRGAWGGNIIEGTVPSLELALKMGADMFECDLSKSTDGVIYAFHDTQEPRLLKTKQNVKTMTSAEIDALEFYNSIDEPSGKHVQRFEEVVKYFTHGELFNIDRSWSILAEIHLELKNSNYLRDFVTVSRQVGLRIDDIEANQAYVGSGLSVYTITFTIFSAELKKYKTHREIIQALSSLDYIYHIEELR